MGLFDQSKKDQRSDDAKEWRKLYKTALWLRGRAHHLRNNPLCVFCLEQGRAEPATILDHIKEHKGDKGLFYDPKNWQSLCKPCHDRIKQKMEKNAHLPEIGLDGWPVEK
jgi:5-methylcytosine-specific restriction protein A